MRQIKFRAWDGKMMVFHADLQTIAKSEVVANYDWDTLEVMQYTGLKDKNGKEIYEGDILETPNGKRIVRYMAPNFCLAPNSHEDVNIDSFSTPCVLEEIIGNIYQNPELITN